MFDLGFWELVLIGVIALMVVGPDRLPSLAKQAGTWIGNTKRFVNSVRADLERELQSEELKRLLNDQQNEIKQLKGMISETQAEVRAELREGNNLGEATKGQTTPDTRESRPSNEQTGSSTTAAQLSDAMMSDDGAKRFTGG
jgi:sec-independent protein translocase protein TatB